jgi:hypothetical protein
MAVWVPWFLSAIRGNRFMLQRTISTLIAAHLAAFATSLSAQVEKVDLVKVPLPAGLLAPEAATSVAARVALLEGPAVDEMGNSFSATSLADCPNRPCGRAASLV